MGNNHPNAPPKSPESPESPKEEPLTKQVILVVRTVPTQIIEICGGLTKTNTKNVYFNQRLNLHFIDTGEFSYFREDGSVDLTKFQLELLDARRLAHLGPFVKSVFFVCSKDSQVTKELTEHARLINSLGNDIWSRVLVIIDKPGENERDMKGAVDACRRYTKFVPRVFGYDCTDYEAEVLDMNVRTKPVLSDPERDDFKNKNYSVRTVREYVLGSFVFAELGFCDGLHEIVLKDKQCRMCGIVPTTTNTPKFCHKHHNGFRWVHPSKPITFDSNNVGNTGVDFLPKIRYVCCNGALDSKGCQLRCATCTGLYGFPPLKGCGSGEHDFGCCQPGSKRKREDVQTDEFDKSAVTQPLKRSKEKHTHEVITID